jgi:hypothetical protein
MKLLLGEEHQILKETAAEFVRSKTSLKRIRALRAVTTQLLARPLAR